MAINLVFTILKSEEMLLVLKNCKTTAIKLFFFLFFGFKKSHLKILIKTIL